MHVMKGLTMPERWLRCSISPGMFTNELVVKTEQGRSFFVPREFVEGNVGSPGRVRVRLLSSESGTWVIMPSEDLAQVEVMSNQLETIRG